MIHVQLEGECEYFPKQTFLKIFCKFRLNSTMKFSNQEFAHVAKKQRKLFKIQSNSINALYNII